MEIIARYKVMLNLKRLSTKELLELEKMTNAELKQRKEKNNDKKSMLEHGKIGFKNILKTMFPKRKRS